MKRLDVAAGLIAALLASACIAPSTQTTADGLVEVRSSRLDRVYLHPDLVAGAYNKVIVEPVAVEWRSDYLTQQHAYNRTRGRQMPYQNPQAVADEAASYLRAALADGFRSAGYEIVSTPGAHTLRLSAEVADLFIDAPEVISTSPQQDFVRNAADANLSLVMRDAITAGRVAKIAHHAADTQPRRLTFVNDASNWLSLEVMFQRWAAYCAAEMPKPVNRPD